MILFLFIDGVGLGAADSEHNPLALHPFKALETLAGGQRWIAAAQSVDAPDHLFRPIDATLGVEGLPQSGTGQATLFTGVNCAEMAGRHFGPFPHSKTKPVLAAENLFGKVQRCRPEAPRPAAFANAYPPRFFRYARRKDRWTVTTRCCLEAGLPLRTTEDLKAGRALAADLTRAGWKKIGLDVPTISEGTAAEHFVGIGRRHALTLFEYYLTDKAGHSRDPARARRVLTSLDRFLAGLLRRIDPARELLLLTSDHGNLEDLSTKSHTRNPVPLIAYGRGAGCFRPVRDLTGVVPALLRALSPG